MKRTSIFCAALLFSGSAFAGQAGHPTGNPRGTPTPTQQAAPATTTFGNTTASNYATQQTTATGGGGYGGNANAYGGQGGTGGNASGQRSRQTTVVNANSYQARQHYAAPGMAIGFSSGTCVPYGLLGSGPGVGFGFQFPDNGGVCPSLEIAKFLAANGCRDAALAVAVGGDRIRALQDYPCGTPRQVVLRRRY